MHGHTDTPTQLPSLRCTHQIPNVVKTAENLHFPQVMMEYEPLCVYVFPCLGQWTVAVSKSLCVASQWRCGLSLPQTLTSSSRMTVYVDQNFRHRLCCCSSSWGPKGRSPAPMCVSVCVGVRCSCDCWVRIMEWTMQWSSGIKHLCRLQFNRRALSFSLLTVSSPLCVC